MIRDTNETQSRCPICRFMARPKNAEAFQHLRNARKEMLLAVKSVIEGCIERLESVKSPAPACKAHKIDID